MKRGRFSIGLISGLFLGVMAAIVFASSGKAWCIPYQVPESYANKRGLSLDTVEVLFRDDNPYSLPETYWCYTKDGF